MTLPATKRLVFDMETFLIEPGAVLPMPVAGSVSHGDAVGLPRRNNEITDLLKAAADDPNIIVVGHNVAFDMGVILNWYPYMGQYIWKLYDEGRVSCTKVREQLIEIARGTLRDTSSFGLDRLVMDYLQVDISQEKKNPNSWRLRYSELAGVDFGNWPKEALDYMCNDSALTDAVWHKQGEYMLVNEAEQCRADFALILMQARGMVCDPVQTATAKETLQKTIDEHAEFLKGQGLIVWNKKENRWSKKMKVLQEMTEAAYVSQGFSVPMTAGGKEGKNKKTATNKDALLLSNNPTLIRFQDYADAASIMSKFVVNVLETGCRRPLHPRFNVLVATGRTSCTGGMKTKTDGKPMGYNAQQVCRSYGIRQAFVARPGFVIIASDYSAAELCTLAQICYTWFGYSDMRDAINAGIDLHVDMGAQIIGTSYEDLLLRCKQGDPEAKEYRQMAKAANFGLPGGLGAETFVEYARTNYGVIVTEAKAEAVKAAWKARWKEVVPYLKYIATLCANSSHRGSITQFASGRIRGDASFCALANTGFQGLSAEGAKDACYESAKECYHVPESALYGTYPINFVHDEIMAESPEEKAPAAAVRLSEVMVSSMKKYTPDVKITCEPSIMRRWDKRAEAVYDAAGNLTIWEERVA